MKALQGPGGAPPLVVAEMRGVCLLVRIILSLPCLVNRIRRGFRAFIVPLGVSAVRM